MRLANMLQSVVGCVGGVAVGFYFDWMMTLVSLAIAVILVLAQMAVFNYLQKRGRRDIPLADDLSRVGQPAYRLCFLLSVSVYGVQEWVQIAAEAITNVKTVQALTREKYLFDEYCRACEAPKRAAIIRG